MMQHPTRICRNCGASAPNGQHFCSNCGESLDDLENKPTAFSSETPTGIPDESTRMSSPTLPPTSDGPPYTRYPPQIPPPPPQASSLNPPTSVPVPTYATPQKGNSSKVWRGIGCGVGIAALLALVICGSIGYFVYRGASSVVSNVAKTATATGAYNSGSNNVTPTLGPATTTAIGSMITYASIDMTIVDVKQAQSFADDDNSSGTPGVVRLDLKEQNTTTKAGNFLYSGIARLLLPDGSKVGPLNEHESVAPDVSITRTNWLDFPVSTATKINQLTLILGADDEAQMSVPLTGSADLTKYKPKTTSPNKTTQYEGMNWTMTSATSSWSSKGVQAKKGMVYVTVTFKIDNPSQKNVDEYWPDLMRLKAGSVVSSPESGSDFPLSFAAGSSGKTGSESFLVPQGNTAFTFILKPSPTAANQATIDFQIQ